MKRHEQSRSPSGANLLRHLDLQGLEILELGGAGGELSRYLADRAVRFLASPAPAAGDGLFDLVVLVESGSEDGGESCERRLAAALSQLKEGGLLALAADNPLGLGHWAGQPDKDSGAYFSGIAGGERPGQKRCRREWRQYLAGLGLQELAEYLLAPEVRQPGCVLRRELLDVDLELAVDLFCHQPFADPTLPSFPLLPPALLAESVARAGLLADFAPGFLWLCGRPESAGLLSGICRSEAGRSLGWHYSLEREPATRTSFTWRDGRVWVSKEALSPIPAREGLRWNPQEDQPALRGERWRQRLLRLAYFESGAFEDELTALLAQLKERFARGPDRLEGRALDAILHNAILEDGETRLFDLEWELLEDLPASWWVLRNVLALAPNLETIGQGIGARSLGELYDRLCRRLSLAPALDADVHREARLQGALGGDAETSRAALDAVLARRVASSPFPPRHPERLGPWQTAMEGRIREVETLSAAFFSVSKLAEDLRWLAETVERQQRSLESIDAALRWLAEKVAEKG